MSEQGVLKAVLKGRLLNAVETRNVFYYGSTIPEWGAYDEPHDYQAVMLGVVDICQTVNDILSQEMFFYEIDVYQWDGAHWVGLQEYTISIGGSLASDPSGFQPALLFSMGVGIIKTLGRKFIPGIAEGSTTAGAIAISAMSTALNVLDAIMAERAHGGRIWVPGIPTKTSAFAPFLTGAVGTIISSMRRRKPGYGI